MATNGGGVVVDVAQLSHEFKTRAGVLPVLHGIDCQFRAGTWTAVMGPSGSGKSTFLNCLAGLIKATAGRITVDGLDVTKASERQLTELRRSAVGFVFQAFNLVPALTVAQNVALPRLFARRRAPKRDVYAALNEVAIRDKATSTPDAISGGQQQRAAVARALFIGPKAVFADEPTGALDIRSAAAVLDQFDTLVKAGACVVMVTHDPAVAARADRVLFLVDGRFHSELQGAGVDRIAAQAASWELARAAS